MGVGAHVSCTLATVKMSLAKAPKRGAFPRRQPACRQTNSWPVGFCHQQVSTNKCGKNARTALANHARQAIQQLCSHKGSLNLELQILHVSVDVLEPQNQVRNKLCWLAIRHRRSIRVKRGQVVQAAREAVQVSGCSFMVLYRPDIIITTLEWRWAPYRLYPKTPRPIRIIKTTTYLRFATTENTVFEGMCFAVTLKKTSELDGLVWEQSAPDCAGEAPQAPNTYQTPTFMAPGGHRWHSHVLTADCAQTSMPFVIYGYIIYTHIIADVCAYVYKT